MALAGLLVLLAPGVAAARAPAFFDPPRHPDARDAEGIDVRRAAFGQRDLRMVLHVRLARRWAPRPGRSVCLVLGRDGGRVCFGRGVLLFTREGGGARVIPAAVSRPDGRTLRASFRARFAGLPHGPVRWALEARTRSATDRVPDRGFLRASVRVLAQPRCFGAAARDRLDPCRNPLLRRLVFPRPTDALIMNNSPCRRLGRGRRLFEPCEFGVTGGGHRGTFLLVGDSHSLHWRRSLEVVAEARRWRGISVARPGCPFSTLIPRTPALGPGQCARLHRATIAWLRAHPEVETLFVSNWSPPGSAPIGGNAAYGGGAATYGAMLDRVPASVKRIYVLRDIPGTTRRAMACVKARRRRGLPAGRACATRRSAVLVPDPGATAARARAPRARALDFTRFFCGRTRCFPVIGGAYVYKDDNHMNAVFAASLGPFVLRALHGS